MSPIGSGRLLATDARRTLRAMVRVWCWRLQSPGPSILNRTDLLNFLIAKRGYCRYLEIGVRDPRLNFDVVRAAHKESVDPHPLGDVTWKLRSDDFFAGLDQSATYDLIFLDGFHEEEQVRRDIENGLAHLSSEGAIVVHDCNPTHEDWQTMEYDGVKPWTGTVWRGWARLRASRPDLSMQVVDIDYGCGVITHGAQRCFPRLPASLDYKFLDQNRSSLLNLVTPEEFVSQL